MKFNGQNRQKTEKSKIGAVNANFLKNQFWRQWRFLFQEIDFVSSQLWCTGCCGLKCCAFALARHLFWVAGLLLVSSRGCSPPVFSGRWYIQKGWTLWHASGIPDLWLLWSGCQAQNNDLVLMVISLSLRFLLKENCLVLKVQVRIGSALRLPSLSHGRCFWYFNSAIFLK